MSDIARLKDKLTQLAAPGSDAAPRRLAAPDAAGLTAAILDEIDTTVLGRALEFRNARDEVLGLDVTGRRLVSVRQVPETSAAAAFSAFLGKPLTGAEAEALRPLGTVVAAFVGDGGPLTLTARPLSDRTASGGDIGCTPAVLAEAWAIPQPDTHDGGGLAAFIVACTEQAGAWLVLAGDEIVEKSGSAARLDRLARAARGGLSGAVRLKGPDPACLILRHPGGRDLLFHGYDGALDVLMFFPAEASAQLLALWRTEVEQAAP